ncbi:unnamed protein product [Dicrocoelium dendriticum]|nr:unnamed protein product [Dicrocoelium dendriticum]
MDGSSVNLPTQRRVLNPRNTNPNLSGITSPIFDSLDQRAILWSCAPKDVNIFHCNVGDCHAAGQLPITFFRQIMAGLCLPCLLDDITFPTDVKRRVKLIRNSCHGHSVGSYSDILGIRTLREAVADFIEQRDEFPSNIDDIFLTCGATEAIRYLLCLLSTGLDGAKRAGIMLPIPQFPFYSATITEFNLYQIGYYLDETRNWDLNPEELTRALTEARDRCIPRAIVVINPGNPTGQVLSRESMEQVIRFAVQHGLVLLADEVYQFNVHYPEFYPWISFKRVLHEMGAGFADRLEMASFMSCSKGYVGEYVSLSPIHSSAL